MEGDRTPIPFTNASASERGGGFSPDSKFLVYRSDEGGKNQIYVQPIPPNGSKWLVSKDGGADPIWKGSEIYFVSPDTKLMAVPVKTSPSFSSGTPQPLFDLPGKAYDVAGPNRFLFALPISGAQPPMTVISDWQAAH